MGAIDHWLSSARLQPLCLEEADKKNIQIYVQRDDLIHPVFGGNKIRKLTGYLDQLSQSDRGLVTIGGAFSNHLVACAGLANHLSIPSIGLVRYHQIDEGNPTMIQCRQLGMKLVPIGRQSPEVHMAEYLQQGLTLIPEGASERRATLGFQQVIQDVHAELIPNYIVTSVGLGATMAGLARYADRGTKVIGVGSFHEKEMSRIRKQFASLSRSNVNMVSFLEWGRFGRYNKKIEEYTSGFLSTHGIRLDPIYTAKTFAFVENELIDELPADSKVLIYHSGGLQGWTGWDWRYSSMTGAK